MFFVFGLNLNATNDKGFSKKYIRNAYKNNTPGRYTLISENEFGNKDHAYLQDDYNGNIIPVYKDINGDVRDTDGDGKILYPN